jgi:hypothetical protein
MLVDSNHEVSQKYHVLKWAVASGKPGHSFTVIDITGKIAWMRDYGSPNLADRSRLLIC